MKRPTTVTVVCWFLIITSGLSLMGALATMKDPTVQETLAKGPLPANVQQTLTFGFLALEVISAVFMLTGANWARWLYIVGGGISVAMAFFTSGSPLMVLPALVIYAIFVFLLTRPEPSKFFTTPHKVERHDPDEYLK